MSEVIIMTILQPCIMCEHPLEQWDVWKDEETGAEWYDVRPLHHHCEPLRALIRERQAAGRAQYIRRA